jgi:hypothetical protein
MPTSGKIRFHLLGWVCAVVAIALLGSGCATNRGILDVRVNELQNPASGRAVTIVRVADLRLFEKAPAIQSIPSLMGGEIDDKAITSRAIARKRNGYGKALGDILLPEGRTVEDIVREALVTSFRESGYRVIDDAAESKDGNSAVPIEADIKQFWSWITPGFWAVSMEFEAIVDIKGDVPPFGDGGTVRGHVNLHTQGAGTRAWSNTIDKGIEAFIEEVKKRLVNE